MPSSVKYIEGNNFLRGYYVVFVEYSRLYEKIYDSIEILEKMQFEDEKLYNAIFDQCKYDIVEKDPEKLELVLDDRGYYRKSDESNIYHLELSNLGIESLTGLEKYPSRKTEAFYIDVSSNSITDITPIYNLLESNAYSSITIDLQNQRANIDILKKEFYLDILAKSQNGLGGRYASGTNNVITGKIKIENNTITLDDDFTPEDIATIGITGGKLDGSVYTLKIPDDITVQYQLSGDKLNLLPEKNGKEIKIEDIDLYYSLDNNEYQKYEENTIIPKGAHNLKVKFFDKVLLDEDIQVTITNVAVRENGKIYIYSGSYANNQIQYSFNQDTGFNEYNGAIENTDAEKIFLKLGEDETKEVEVQELKEIHDIETKSEIFGDAYRVDGVITLDYKADTGERAYYSFDKKYWTEFDASNVLKINNIDADTIYILSGAGGLGGTTAYISYYSIRNVSKASENKYSEIIGTYTENDNSYIFGQDRAYSVEELEDDSYNRKKYTITSDDNDIQQVKDGKIIDMTTIMGETLILKQDGKVYKIGEDYEDLQEINGASKFTQIDGRFATDEDNDIWSISYNYTDNTYQYVNITRSGYQIRDTKVKKLLSVMKNYGSTQSSAYVLYTNGDAEIIGPFANKTFIAENVIDIAADDDTIYALQYDKVICKDSISEEIIDISELIRKGEFPVKINKQGAILTNNGNYYEMTIYKNKSYDTFKDTLNIKNIGYKKTYSLKDGIDKIRDTSRSYSLSDPIKTEVASIGNYTYQYTNGDVYYRTNEKVYNYDYYDLYPGGEYKSEEKEAKVYKKAENNITITKDESKLDQDKVIINVHFPNNEYTVKTPDGTTTKENNIAYTVTENGQYVFEFTDLTGYTSMRTVHVTTIQSRREIKVPEVTALNGKIILKSDDEIEYSLDNQNWNKYTQEIEYKEPIYARIKNDKYECSTIKITINEKGHLNIKNTGKKIKSGLLTNGIGTEYTKTINYNGKIDDPESQTSTDEKKSLFNYISKIADDIIYTFSSTDGKYAGCYFEDNGIDITYKDIDNNIVNINGDKYNTKNDSNIEYRILYTEENYADCEEYTEEDEIRKVENGDLISYEKETIWGTQEVWIETCAKYAYVDSEGNLVSNIELISKAKEVIEKKNDNIKYTKIVGDGVTYYILTEQGDVYIATRGDNGTWTYLVDKLSIDITTSNSLSNNSSDSILISKLNLRDIVDIYDSATALTKDGKIVSLIEDNEESTSQVQELQSQTDKYLMVSHLGLKDGKLYNFDDVQNGTEVTAGKIVESEEAKYGIYSESGNTITLFDNEYKAKNATKSDGEIYIDIQESDDTLPEFVDIAEYRNSYLAMIVPYYTRSDWDRNESKVVLSYLNADPYALCYAISTDGEIWLYISGYIVDTGINLDFFGPTTNYALNDTKWTNQNLNLVYTENTTNKIVSEKVKKGDDVIAENNTVTIEKNGTYNIEVVDSKNRSYLTTLNVVNIDKVKPVVEAKGKIQNGVATITAYDVEDKTGDYGISGIAKIKVTTEYPSENTKWTELEGTINEDGVMISELKEIEKGKKLYAIATDNAGNESDVTEIELKIDAVALEKKVAGKTEKVDLNAAKKDDVLVYSVVVTNTGTTAITSVKLTDELLNINNKEYTFETLNPSESIEISLGEYTVTQSDIDKQQPIKNVITAENGEGPSETETPVEPERKSVALQKKVAGKTKKVNLNSAKKDDVLVYSVVVTNKGNTTMTSVKLTDELLNINNKEYTLDSLKPGESIEIALGEYTVTQSDVDKQQPIKNVITAEYGEGPSETNTPVEPKDNKAPILPYTGLATSIGFSLIVIIIISCIGVLIYKKRR